MLLRTTDLREYHQDTDDAQAPPTSVPAIGLDGKITCLVGTHGVDLEELFPPLEHDHTYLIPSLAHWSLHEFIAFMLSRTGPAHVRLSTWGITTKPLQAILDQVRSGNIIHLHLLLDHRVQLSCPQAFQLLRALTDEPRVTSHLTKIHAKLVVITNDQWQITIATSANLTVNKRIENYVVITHPRAAAFTSSWMEEVRDGAQPFGHDRG